jgi:hypothetical protein
MGFLATIFGKGTKRLMTDKIVNVGSLTMSRGNITVLGPYSVDADSTHFRTKIDKTFHTRSGVQVDCAVEVSYDGGQTWQERGKETDVGGVTAVDDDGQPITDFYGEYDLLPQKGQTARQCRVVITAVNGAFTSTGGEVVARKDALTAELAK